MDQRLGGLTDEEKDVLRLWVEDLTAKEIGRRLNIADRTVYQRLSRSKLKAGVATPMQAAVLLAQEEGRPAYAPIAHQEVHVAASAATPQHTLVALLVPEASGRTINDLTIPQRLVVIASRAILAALLTLAIAALLFEVSRVLQRWH